MKKLMFLITILIILLAACDAEEVALDENDDVTEDILSGNSYDFNVQGFGMENTIANLIFSGGSVTDGEDVEGTYFLEAETINIKLTHQSAMIELVLITEDFGDGSYIEGHIETYEVEGHNFDEERIEEVDEFEGLDFVLERVEEDVEIE